MEMRKYLALGDMGENRFVVWTTEEVSKERHVSYKADMEQKGHKTKQSQYSKKRKNKGQFTCYL